MSRRKLTRRDFLQLGTMVAASVALPRSVVGATSSPPSAAPKLGAQFIGKLEGPTIVTDPKQYPNKYGEAPMLAELVKAGKLPPLENRLPDATELMVIKPLKEIGKYGGRWRRGFTGPADSENGNRI